MRWLGVAVVLGACTACESTAPFFEAIRNSPDAGAAFPPLAVETPVPAAVTTLTPCPTGWREAPGQDALDAVTCEPWPAAGYQRCADDEAHLPGTPGCARVGSSCPADGWPEGLPTTAPVRYVRLGAVGGTGSKAQPFGRIADALAGAPVGTIVALASGSYSERVGLPAGVSLWGACVRDTTLGSTVTSTTPAVAVLGAGATLRNLRVSGNHPGVYLDGAGLSVELRDVVLSGLQVFGVLAFTGSQVSGENVVIRGTRARAQGDFGQGIEAGAGATVELGRVLLDGNGYRSVLASGAGTRIHLTDVAVRSTDELSGSEGRALSAHQGARIEVERAALEQNRDSAVYAEDGATMVLRHAVVRETTFSRSQPDNGIGVAITGAHVELVSVSVERNRARGVWVVSGATGDLTDVVVRDTQEQSSSRESGQGVLVTLGATLHATRLTLERNHKAGLEVGSDATVDVTDVVARRTLAQVSDQFEGAGVEVTGGAVTLTRARLEQNTCGGLVIGGASAGLVASDVVVRDTQSCPDGFDGTGLVVQQGAVATVTRALFERNASDGIFAALPGTRLTAVDVVSRDETGERSIGQLGNGLHVQQQAVVQLTRALFERNREVSIFVVDGARVQGTDVHVLDALETACPPATCLARGGIAAAVVDGASLDLKRFAFARAANVGLYLGTGGVADLSDGVIGSNPIGAAVTTDGFDVQRISQGVEFVDNGRKLDSQQIPLPAGIQSVR